MQKSLQSNRVFSAVLVLILWLASAVVGIWQIALIREMLFRLIARFSAIPQSEYEIFKQANLASALGTWLIVILTIIWIAVFIGSAEYHYRHFREPRSWRLFAWIIGVQLAILLLALFI